MIMSILLNFFYRKEKEFKIHNIKCIKPSDQKLKLALDFPDDLKKT